MGKYINGKFIGPGEAVDNRGYVYDVIYKHNPQKTKLKTIMWISEKSSVANFSWWKDYYDFSAAGKETIQEYVRDINSHKVQVNEFLADIPIEAILDIKNNIPKNTNETKIANLILEALGYEFVAESK